jgi:type I restriction enzyme S subunit
LTKQNVLRKSFVNDFRNSFVSEKPTLGDLCVAVIDCEHKTAPEDPMGPYYSVGTPAMSGHKIDFSKAKRISEATFNAWTRRGRPALGDIILAREAPVGLVVRVPEAEQVALGQRTVLLRPDEAKVDPGFLYYALVGDEMQARMNARAEGSTVAHLNVAEVRELQFIDCPPLAEQRAVAGVLGALDDKIESNRRVVGLLRQTAQAVVASAVQSAELVPLQSVATIQRGFGYKSSGFVDVGVPMISMGSSGVRGWLNRKKIRQYGPAVKDKYRVHAGQVLVVNVDLTWKLDVLGWPLVVPPEFDGAFISNDIFGLECDRSRPWLSWIIWAELQTPRARAVIEGGAKGTTVASIGVDTLSSVQISLPNDAAGAAVGAEVSELVNRAWQAEREVDSLTQTRDALLPHLLSGRLRVRDAEKVVEEVV